MAYFFSDEPRSRLLDEFEQIRAEYRAEMERLHEDSRQQLAEIQQREAQQEKELAEWVAVRQAEAEAEKAKEEDVKPPHPWAKRAPMPDAATRIGQLDDEEHVPAEAPSVAPTPPGFTIAPQPQESEKPEPSSRWHADDDFEQGNFLRG